MDSTSEWFECVWENEHHAESMIQNFLEHNMEQVASLLRQSAAPTNMAARASNELVLQAPVPHLQESPAVAASSSDAAEEEISETLAELLALQESLNSLLTAHGQQQNIATERLDPTLKSELLRSKAESKEAAV